MKKVLVLIAAFSMLLLPVIFAPITVDYIPNTGSEFAVSKVMQNNATLAENNPSEAVLADNSKSFTLHFANVATGQTVYVFEAVSCPVNQANPLAKKDNPLATDSIEVPALNFAGATEKNLIACQYLAAGGTVFDSIKIKAAGSPIATTSIVEALAQIDKKLVDGIFN